MPSYLVVDLDIHDAPGLAEYVKNVPAIVAKHGGKYIVRGGKIDVMEGDWNPKRMSVLEFPSTDAIKEYLSDPEYAPYKAMRHRAAKTNAIAVEGV